MKKKIILLFGLLLILSGCKKEETEEIECPEPEEKVLIKYKDTELTEDDLLEETKEYTFPLLYEKVKGNILKEEMKEHLKDGEDNVENTMNQMDSIYGSELEEAIKQYTSYSTIEEYKEALLINYLENEYVKQYICQKENIEYEEITDENSLEYYKKYYIKSIKELFKKYDVEFEDKEYKKLYEKYIKEIEEYYGNQ